MSLFERSARRYGLYLYLDVYAVVAHDGVERWDMDSNSRVDVASLELSIVVPVYNALPFLKDCIQSIVSQGLDESRYEVILVDDGSTDGSGEYCDEVVSAHPNFRVVHQQNSGFASRPRNVGLDLAQGEFIHFCDADDVFLEGALPLMLQHARELGCDVGLFKVDARDWKTTYGGLFSKSRTHCTFDNANLADFYGSYRLMKRSLLEAHHIRFQEDMCPEDWAFALECYLCAQNICVIGDRYYYHWRKRPDGRSLTMGGTSALTDDWHAMYRGHEAYIDVAKRYNALDRYPQILVRLYRAVASIASSVAAGKRPAEMAEAYGKLIAPLQTEGVRRLLPLSVLVPTDALVAGVVPEELGQVVPFANRIEFVHNRKGPIRYTVRSADGKVLLDCPLPANPGKELSSPKTATYFIEEATLDELGMHMAGTAFILRTCPGPVSDVRLRVAFYGKKQSFDVAVDYSILQCSWAYGNVWQHRIYWSAFLPAEVLSARASKFEKSVRADLSLVLKLGDDNIALRLGKNSSREAFQTFENAPAIGECIEPVITGFGNFSLRVVHSSSHAT